MWMQVPTCRRRSRTTNRCGRIRNIQASSKTLICRAYREQVATEQASLLRYINALLEPLECSALAQPGGKAYFDMKDGASAKDKVGLRFQTSAAAIEHGKHLARRLRGDRGSTTPISTSV